MAMRGIAWLSPKNICAGRTGGDEKAGRMREKERYEPNSAKDRTRRSTIGSVFFAFADRMKNILRRTVTVNG